MADITALEYVPDMPDIAGSMSGVGKAIMGNMTTIYIIAFVSVILWLFYKMSRYRIQIDRYTPVQGGYVHNSGRYRLVYDSATKRPAFEPMVGGDKLPAYDSKYYQKTKGGLPFIGPIHHINMVFANKYSPVICDSDGVLQYVDNKRWLFDMAKSEFKKKFDRGNLAYFLAIYAPLMVILGAFVFWIITIFIQVNVLESFGSQLAELVKRLGG